MRVWHTDHSQLEGAAAIDTAGALAGSCQEVVSHYTQALEQHGVRGALRVHKTSQSSLPIPWRTVVTAAPASAIGFLAFEYGRTVASHALQSGPAELDAPNSTPTSMRYSDLPEL